jgi:protein phosphatase
MGSRAVVVACKDPAVVQRRFAIDSAVPGCVYTRTGRPFFSDSPTEADFVDKVCAAIGAAGLCEELNTDWLVLDCELLPWSAKAEQLLRSQYASVGAAGSRTLGAEVVVIETACARGVEVGALAEDLSRRAGMVEDFITAYGRYCWPVESLGDLKLAPFQILAGEGQTHALSGHLWHLEVLGRLCAADPTTFRRTANFVVELNDGQSVDQAVAWWEELTGSGGEGMVVKPTEVVHRGQKGLAQPGIKCRGREYLRIIYGPEYTAERHLSRLKARGLGHKRSLALREFGLGIEALERFVAHEPLYRVHECVFGVLALESEPVDPRL